MHENWEFVELGFCGLHSKPHERGEKNPLPNKIAIQAQVGGIFGIPCLCNSPFTLSSAGALRPRGSGSHGFDKTSPMAASMLSFDC